MILEKYIPCFCITMRNLMMTLEEGLIITWRFPLFSALYILLRASFKTLTLTMISEIHKNWFNNLNGNEMEEI